MEVPAGVFKARCLQLMDVVAESGRELVITKRGRPVAKLVAYSPAPKRDIFGCMAGTVTIVGDIVSPLEDVWDATR